MEATGIIFAALDCDADAIEDWNRWYDLDHTPANVVLPGVQLSRRYVATPELHEQRLDKDFVAAQRARPGQVIALLPGSRKQELEDNGESLLRTAALIHARRPDTRFLVACLKPEHRDRIEARRSGSPLPVEVHAGRTPEIIHLARRPK